MQRRDFLVASTAVAAGLGATSTTPAGQKTMNQGKTFALDYAPHLGMFRNLAGDDPIDQIEFMADQGFRSFEDNGMAGRPIELQERMAAAMERRGIRMGVFVANPGTAWQASFSAGDASMREQFLTECRKAVDVAKRVNATWMTVVPGRVTPRLDHDYQTAHCVDQLRRAAEIFEPHGLVMVLEPLNPWRDHAGMLLARTGHAYSICRAVNSPACKILFDIYHQQIAEGNLIPNIDASWDEIAYFQIGDNPGRKEPTTGEINYTNVLKHIKQRGFAGVLGMEHGNSQRGPDGEQAVIDAYRTCDPA